MPAEAGIQWHLLLKGWIPAFAGMTGIEPGAAPPVQIISGGFGTSSNRLQPAETTPHDHRPKGLRQACPCGR